MKPGDRPERRDSAVDPGGRDVGGQHRRRAASLDQSGPEPQRLRPRSRVHRRVAEELWRWEKTLGRFRLSRSLRSCGALVLPLRTPSDEAEPSPPAPKGTAKAEPAAKAPDDSAADALLPLRKYLSRSGRPIEDREIECRLAEEGCCAEALITIQPDPVDSRFRSLFDLQLASVQQAIEKEGYVLDRLFSPGCSQAGQPLRAAADSQERKAAFRDRPGLILYRRTDDAKTTRLLLLLVVGETATWGVQRGVLRESGDSPAVPRRFWLSRRVVHILARASRGRPIRWRRS